ncbi:MAG: RNA methyltransferase, partial [Dysgonamonadaceae bacterium]|nr:RNA methyltransferase [Dysgonamonadaceae bacterium]
MNIITSIYNERIKNVLKLASKSKERKEQNLFVVEGARELSLAKAGAYECDSVFVCSELFAASDYPKVLENVLPERIFEVSPAVFQKMAYREHSDGITALLKPKSNTLADLVLSENPFIIVLESIEKPGNLGAVLRTADAANVDAVIVCDPLADVYNPNTIRSSIGCVFTVQVAVANNNDALNFLKNKNIRTYAAELDASVWYHETDFSHSSAIVMGAEADGLTDFWLKNADARIKIPMRGKIDSLNVSVSTAILTFEAMRQRG